MSKFFDDTMQGLLEAASIEYKSKIKEKSKSVEDMLYVGIDFSPKDMDIMSVMRRDGDKTYIFNILKNKEAREVYDKLIGNKKDSKKHGHWQLLDECSNAGVYCSECHKKVYKEHYANVKLKSKFCPNCGAIMDGEFERL